MAEDDEFNNVISQSFDNVSMAIDRAIEVMAKCFSKSYGAEVQATLSVLDLDPISKTKVYIFLMEDPRNYCFTFSMSSQDAMSSKSKKRRLAEDDDTRECTTVISGDL